MTFLISETLDPACADWLSQRGKVVFRTVDDSDFKRQLATADALIVRTYTQVTGELLDNAPHLKVIGRAGVGLDNIDLEAARKRNIPVVYTPDANTQAVVEYVLGLILDELRPRTDMPITPSAEVFHAMRTNEVGTQLSDLTLGIVGFGRIGKRPGQVAHAIGMNLLVCDLLPEHKLRQAVDFPFDFVGHMDLYEHSDIVSLHVDGRPSNRHLINALALGHFKSQALLINAARGMLVDAPSLAEWARRYPHARAILDVHDPEPPSGNYPLYDLTNVRLLPHLASRTNTAMRNMSWVVRDVVAVLEGRDPQYLADSANPNPA